MNTSVDNTDQWKQACDRLVKIIGIDHKIYAIIRHETRSKKQYIISFLVMLRQSDTAVPLYVNDLMATILHLPHSKTPWSGLTVTKTTEGCGLVIPQLNKQLDQVLFNQSGFARLDRKCIIEIL